MIYDPAYTPPKREVKMKKLLRYLIAPLVLILIVLFLAMCNEAEAYDGPIKHSPHAITSS